MHDPKSNTSKCPLDFKKICREIQTINLLLKMARAKCLQNTNWSLIIMLVLNLKLVFIIDFLVTIQYKQTSNYMKPSTTDKCFKKHLFSERQNLQFVLMTFCQNNVGKKFITYCRSLLSRPTSSNKFCPVFNLICFVSLNVSNQLN